MNASPPLLNVTDLQTHFFTAEGVVRAVDGVSFQLREGETLGLVGESGCGKTVTALSILRLIPDPPGKIVGGSIKLGGRELLELTEAQMRKIRGNEISIIFQEPMTSLNPVFTIGNQISEAIILHQGLSKKAAMEKSIDMLRLVAMANPERRVREYPHQLSGGMRQRAMIAMALSCNPKVLLADEPTTALDVTIQAQILDLMLKLKEELGAAIIMITHDLGVVAESAQQIAVMYAGRIVEQGSAKEIFGTPSHPYTQGLLASVPRLDRAHHQPGQRLPEIPGIVPSLYAVPEGCAFHPRCQYVMERCRHDDPSFYSVDSPAGGEEPSNGQHAARCFLLSDSP
ncbi:MAG: ABC transporter ATP-binding protein [Candidatus Tectomicrobia bacterium]|nr:ABC transporter ATP-binding protein [Candidatus Tectomicrobia bacterium]